jgi:protein TonB
LSGQGTHIAWFIALSAALHTAVLLVNNRHEIGLGPAGRMVHVSLSYRGAAAGTVSPAADPAEPSPARRDPPPVTTNRPAPVTANRKTADRRYDYPPHVTAAAQAERTRQAGNASTRGEAAPATSGAGTDRATAEEQLRKSILRLVSSRFDYPLMARRKGMQGIVRLQVRIESDGRISRLQVEQSSGYPLLDRAALRSLRLASVPDAERWMNGRAIDIIIPVEYRLVGG